VVIDSGAGIHVTPNAAFIVNLRSLPQPMPLSGVFGDPQVATHYGEGAVKIGSFTLHLSRILYMPSIKDTLLSYVLLTKAGHLISVAGENGSFVDKDRTVTLPLSCAGNILTFQFGTEQPVPINALTRSSTRPLGPIVHPDRRANVPSAPAVAAPIPIPSIPPLDLPSDDVLIVHARYGHLCSRKLIQLARSGAVKMDPRLLQRINSRNKVRLTNHEQSCAACKLGKMARLKFADQYEHIAERPNDKVVADVCGPIWTTTEPDGSVVKYSLSTITDVYSRHLEIQIITSKDQASDHCICNRAGYTL
jgi:hypothetical protein